jgi:L-2-hydroxycarboxylate dehydrogenase (NAD+)
MEVERQMKVYRFKAEELKAYTVRFFEHFGISKEEAKIVADVLVTADLRGVHSHGLGRLHRYYGNRLRAGLIDPRASIRLIKQTPATLVFDAGNGMGQVAACRAMTACIDKAQDIGVTLATVRNSNHFGIAGYYAMMALEHNMIGISLTNSQPLIAPTYGRTRILGTNPIAVAVPAGQEDPYVLDMATSIVPMGKITLYEEKGEDIPFGWGMDQTGNVTRDPKAVQEGGSLLPLGGTADMRGYKGYGLSLLVDILSGILSGAAYGTGIGSPASTAPPPLNIGHFFMAIQIDAFRQTMHFKSDMDGLIAQLKGAPKAPGKDRIYIHGEKEFEQMRQNTHSGIPLIAPVVETLQREGDKVGVPFDVMPIS